MINIRNIFLIGAVAGGLMLTAAHADQAQDAAAFENFQLSEDFIAKYQAAQLDIVKDVCQLSPMFVMGLGRSSDEKMSLDQASARYDAQPGVHDMLASHGLTAKNMLLGVGTLFAAAAQDLKQAHPDMVHSKMRVSAANMAFYHSHKDALRAFNRKLGQQQLHANGGKLPSCMKQ